ncbi:MAG: hypothetical protein GX424_05255 [Clostridiales bacterium]|nr:hypothetical protein [Clostridiales bacterium]
MRPKWMKLGVLICFTTFLMCGFQSPFSTDLSASSFAKNGTSHTGASYGTASAGLIFPFSSSVSSAIDSTGASSATSSAASSESTSSKAASKQSASSAAKAKPKPIVPTKTQLKAATKKLPTKQEMAEEDPENNKEVSATPVKNSVSVSAVSSKLQSSAVSSNTPSSVQPSSSGVSSKAASSSASSSQPSSSNFSSSGVSSAAPSLFTGWKTIDGVKYFYYQNNPLTGWQTIEGKKYNFDGKGALKTRIGIDVSSHQGYIDWNKVKAAGIEFAILRAGYRGYVTGSYNKDPYFERNYAGAKAAGISVGVYFFSQAISVDEAVAEAQFTLDILGGRSLSEPIAFDTEYVNDDNVRTNLANLTSQQRTDFAVAFCEKIKSSGYRPMVYASKNWFYNDLIVSRLAPYTTWVAQYYSSSASATWGTNYQYPYQYWQYTSSGQIDGVYSSGLDMDISF